MFMTIHNTVMTQLCTLMAFIKRSNDQLNDSESHLNYAREQERHEAYDLRGF